MTEMTNPAGSLERFEALLGPEGRELLARLNRQAVTPASALRAGSALRGEYPADLVADASAQHELRLRAQAKFDRAGQMFFTRSGLEQASSEVVARYRAHRYA
ncbi:MAG TPA: SAM-dependent methyltransferase, partial [Streptosporangiaceae bacterium]|nr:SAM-dependent methyltransferase [Streptosporangiaceae bacterium]